MKILVYGPRDRYIAYKPDFAHQLDAETVFVPLNADPVPPTTANADAEILFADAGYPVTKELIDLLPNLKLIQSEGVGYNKFDLEAARARGIFVCNSKACNATSVAEHTVMLILMALRFGITGHNAVRAGQQIQMKERVMASNAPELLLSSVGLVGFGDIAQATARRLAPFGCKLYYYSLHRRSPEEEAEFGVTYLPLEELVATCDVTSLHCAVNDQTRGMISAELLEKFKPGAILVNTARGDLLDNLAVRQALIDGKLGIIAMDTIAPEPTPGDHPLVDLPEWVRDRAIYSPHLGGNTGGSLVRAHLTMWSNAQRIMEGQRPNFIVNGL